MMSWIRLFTLGVLVCLMPSCSHLGDASRSPGSTEELREVFLVGNNWDGTVDIFDSQTYERIHKVDVVPDYFQRLRQKTRLNKIIGKLVFNMIAFKAGEGNLQLVDDMFMDASGRYLMASRPSFSDVVKIDIQNNRIVGRVACPGYRSDHATLSPDGKYFIISCTTRHRVYAINVETFRREGNFVSAESPHENTFIHKGKVLLHANIGNVADPISFNELDWNQMDSAPATRPSPEKISQMSLRWRGQPRRSTLNYPGRDGFWAALNAGWADPPLIKLGEEYKHWKTNGSYERQAVDNAFGLGDWNLFSAYGLSLAERMWLDDLLKSERYLFITKFKEEPGIFWGTTAKFEEPLKIDMRQKLYDYFKQHPLGAARNEEGRTVGQWPVDHAIRPMAVYADERHIIFQVSFFHGFFKYRLPDLENPEDTGEVVNMWPLPIPQKVAELQSWEYQLNSAHHGIAINKKKDDTSPTGYSAGAVDRACVAMTMSGYAAIVNLNKTPDYNREQNYALRKNVDYWLFPLVWDGSSDPASENPGSGFTEQAVEQNPTNAKPYWATESEDGTRCFVSVSQQDKVFVINFGNATTSPFLEAILSVGENAEAKRTTGSGTEAYQVPSLKYVQRSGGERLANPIRMPNIVPMQRLATPVNQSYTVLQRGAIYQSPQLDIDHLPYKMSQEELGGLSRQLLSHPQRIRNGHVDMGHLNSN